MCAKTKSNKKKGVTFLNQKDFKDGTFRITKSGPYSLTANIVFNPNADIENPNDITSYFPTDDQEDEFPGGAKGTRGPFNLGFFAAISIEANEVELNLCGKTIQMAEAMYIQQRFFAIIEVGSAPFLTSQGPFNTVSLTTVEDVSIYNGVLGLSSHHGIHGLAPINTYVEDLVIKDFEVAGIQFNGFTNVEIRNIDIGPSSTKVYSNGFYSQARFSLVPLIKLVEADPDREIQFDDRSEPTTVAEIQDNLIDQMDLFLFHSLGILDEEDLKEDIDSYSSWMQAMDLFGNDRKMLPDGASQYGIVLHSHGEAVKGFGAGAGFSTNAIIEDVTIHDLQINTREFVGYLPTDDPTNYVTGTYGDAIDMLTAVYDMPNEDMTNRLDELEYQGNALLDAQVALGVYGVGSMRGKTLIMDPDGEFIDWALNGAHLSGELSCNQDAMRHLNKGIIGLRIEEVNNVDLNNVEISYINNWGKKGTYVCGEYTGPETGGHEDQQKWTGYQGSDSRGISVYGSTNVNFNGVKVNNINSVNGHATAIDLIEASEVDFSGGVEIADIRAGITITKRELADFSNSDDPNEVPIACDIHDSGSNTISGVSSVDSINIIGPQNTEVCDFIVGDEGSSS
jgi:hypothetical protein